MPKTLDRSIRLLVLETNKSVITAVHYIEGLQLTNVNGPLHGLWLPDEVMVLHCQAGCGGRSMGLAFFRAPRYRSNIKFESVLQLDHQKTRNASANSIIFTS
jgi:hypothetical protein